MGVFTSHRLPAVPKWVAAAVAVSLTVVACVREPVPVSNLLAQAQQNPVLSYDEYDGVVMFDCEPESDNR